MSATRRCGANECPAILESDNPNRYCDLCLQPVYCFRLRDDYHLVAETPDDIVALIAQTLVGLEPISAVQCDNCGSWEHGKDGESLDNMHHYKLVARESPLTLSRFLFTVHVVCGGCGQKYPLSIQPSKDVIY